MFYKPVRLFDHLLRMDPPLTCQPLWFTGTSESDVRLCLAINDSQTLDSGKHHEVHNHVAPGLFIYLGLELEDLQCVILYSELCIG